VTVLARQARAAAERVAASFRRTATRSLDEAFATVPIGKLRDSVAEILETLVDEIEGQARAAIEAEGQIVEQAERIAALEAQADVDRLRLLEASVELERLRAEVLAKMRAHAEFAAEVVLAQTDGAVRQ
jgi:hypothetical protein